MEMEIVVPEELPVMTLPGVAFFPQAMLPLNIFEPRYRLMLSEILRSHRLMVVAGLDSQRVDKFEPPHRIASMGMIRACQKNANGTSSLLLQGMVRVKITKIVRERPYRIVALQALHSEAGTDVFTAQKARQKLENLLALKNRLEPGKIEAFLQFLKDVDDQEAVVDLTAYNLCEPPPLKQRLLETLNVHTRLRLLTRYLRQDMADLRLRRRLQGALADDALWRN